jgi:hypothetical protein
LVAAPEKTAYLLTFQPVDKAKVAALPPAQKELVEKLNAENSQQTLSQVALLPAIMFACYLLLIGYFKSRGGYKAVDLGGGGGADH